MLFSLQAALLLATWLNPVNGESGCPNTTCPTGCWGGTILLPFETSACPPVCACKECSAFINDTTKAIVSTPNYPAAYPENILCVWVFVAPPEATKVSVSFSDCFTTESVPLLLDFIGDQDYDEPPPNVYTSDCIDVAVVFDDPTFPNSSSTTYCGVNSPPKTYAKDKVIVLIFSSFDTGYGRYQGFRAKFSACLPPKCPRCSYGRKVIEYDDHGCEECKCKPCPRPKCPRCDYGQQVYGQDEYGCKECRCRQNRQRFPSFPPKPYKRPQSYRYN